jgi:aspartyl aminopeptidase
MLPADGCGAPGRRDERGVCRDLLDFIHASPTPFHCAEVAAARLGEAGFTRRAEEEAWETGPGDAAFVVRGGSLVAWRMGTKPTFQAGFRMIGAHTDSPTLRLKPSPDVRRAGYLQCGVDVYGSPLYATWTDRDLGLAGRVALAAAGGALTPELRLVRIESPVLRIPQLAIHLNREVNDKGLVLNPQDHLPPVIGLGEADGAPGVVDLLARTLGDASPERILAFDLMLFALEPPALGGLDDAFVFSPRLDNQAMCHAALVALVGAPRDVAPTRVIALFDHEEVGSQTERGAWSTLLGSVLARVCGEERDALPRALRRSLLVSADMAHAQHPAWASLHDEHHAPRLNGGPVIKHNARARYATDAATAAAFARLCRAADVPCQQFVNRTDLTCGTTIGPIAAARLGVPTVDVGNPMLSMHSAREMAGARDPALMVRVLDRFFEET